MIKQCCKNRRECESERARSLWSQRSTAIGVGMLPTAIGLGTDSGFRSPMAIVVIGGLITSTFLSLLVIPVVFTYVDNAIIFCRRLFHVTGHHRIKAPDPGMAD